MEIQFRKAGFTDSKVVLADFAGDDGDESAHGLRKIDESFSKFIENPKTLDQKTQNILAMSEIRNYLKSEEGLIFEPDSIKANKLKIELMENYFNGKTPSKGIFAKMKPSLDSNVAKEVQKFVDDMYKTKSGSEFTELRKSWNRDRIYDISDALTYHGSGKTTEVGAAKGTKAVDNSGTVTIVVERNTPIIDWSTIEKIKGDVPGPNEPFKIVEAGLEPAYGGAAVIEFKDGRRLLLGHFDQLNVEVMNAYRSGSFLPAGKFIGRIESRIGNSTAPHLHIEDPTGKADRATILKWMQEKK